MKTLVCACGVALTAAAALPSAAGAADAVAPKKRVAVLEFQGAIPPETLQVITDSARVGALDVASALGLVVMTRESMAAVLKDMGRAPGTCTEGECEVETGRLIGADVVVTGMVSRVEARYVVTVKAHETSGGALLKSEQVDTADQFQLLASVKDATRRCLEPRDGGPAGNVVYTVAGGAKDAPATSTAAIDAAFAARRVVICSQVDTGRWAFCTGGKTHITENEFVRRYRETTGLTDLSSARRTWGRTLASTGLFAALGAGTAILGMKAHDTNLEEKRFVCDYWDGDCLQRKKQLDNDAFGWGAYTVVSSIATAAAGVWTLVEWTSPTRNGSPSDHSLTAPAARGAVDRYNSALKEQIRHDLGPTSEAPARREEPTVRIAPYISPLGAGIAGSF